MALDGEMERQDGRSPDICSRIPDLTAVSEDFPPSSPKPVYDSGNASSSHPADDDDAALAAFSEDETELPATQPDSGSVGAAPVSHAAEDSVLEPATPSTPVSIVDVIHASPAHAFDLSP